MGKESRRRHRRDVTGMIDVIDTMTGVTMGHLGNLSVGGMLLIASVPLTENALYQCCFVLPDSGEESIEVGAHILWVGEASAPGQSWAGVRFLGLGPDTTRHLRAWCQPKP